ncbi:MAG: hypothetical protein U1A78_02755 [Polyangia bacterium]
MRHIAVRAYGQPPCHGEISQVPRPDGPAPQPAGTQPAGTQPEAAQPVTRLPSLPIVGQGRPSAARAAQVWRCSGCGTLWEHEPLPDEAL